MDDAPVTTAPAAPQGDPLAAERIPTDDEDVDHGCCCDPAVWLRPDAVLVTFCGIAGSTADVHLDRNPTARYCEVCAELQAGLLARGGDPCSELCPQKRFGG